MAQPKQPSLTVLGGPLAGTRFPLKDGVFAVGSDPGSPFHLPLPGVGASHARVESGPGGVSIFDMGDPRGVHVNDTRIGSDGVVLRNGDIVWLGTPGEGDVVMLQCILPPRPAVPLPPVFVPPAEAQPPVFEPAQIEEADDASTVAFRPAPVFDQAPTAISEPSAPEPEPVVVEPEPLSAEGLEADEPTPMIEVRDAPAEFVAEEAGFEVMAPEPADDAAALIEAELGGTDSVRAEAAVDYSFDEAGITLPSEAVVVAEDSAARPGPPAGFEDETLSQEPEEASFIVADVPTPPSSAPSPRMPVPVVAPRPSTPSPVAPVLPPLPTPRVTPAPRSLPPALPPRAPAQPPSAPQPAMHRRSGLGSPDASQPPRPAQTIPPVSRRKGPSTLALAAVGVVAIALLGSAGFAVWKLVLSKPVPTPTPLAQVPTPAPTPLPTQLPTPIPTIDATPEATPPPVVLPTAEPTAAPPPAAATPRPTPTPRSTPSARPTPTPRGAAPTPAAAAAGPSPEQQRAVQVAGLLGQADSALSSRQFDQAVSLYDEVLKLEPGNARAQSQRATATAQRVAARKRFVSGRTSVTRAKGGGDLEGFEGAAVQKLDFQGRIEFEMTPSGGIKAGDTWTLRFFVVNEGKKSIRISDMTAAVTSGAQRTGGPQVPRSREIAPQQRALVGEMGGSWQEGTTAWTAEVVVSAKGDTLKNTMTWR